MYWLNYLDRNAIALARLDQLEKDLNLSSTQYQTCVSILFVGYLLGQIPSNMLLNRTRPSRYMGTCMMLWAVVSALTALSKNFTGLLLTRFFLGVTEAPYYPGAVYLISMFYTRKEVATRIAILYTGNILATAFAGLIAAGIFHGLGDVGGISGWRWLFILQGIVTFLIAIVGFFLLPDFPHNTRWLTQEERDLAVSRMALDTVGKGEKTSVWAGFNQAAKDPMVWIFAAMAHMVCDNNTTALQIPHLNFY
jgi:MFS family permease